MVICLAVSSILPSLNGPALTGILFSQPLLNASGELFADAGYSGLKSDCHSPKGLRNVTTTSYGLLPCSTLDTSS